jgi:cysteine-S-conjugate beta-lyase
MKYNFDELIDRNNSDSLKWDGIEERLGIVEKDLLPMWVADMDFKAPQVVIDAILDKAQHGIFGYSGNFNSYYDSVAEWMKKRHGWTIKKEWIVFSSTIVSALSRIVRTYTKPGDKIIVQTPVFSPFYETINNNGRQVVKNPLKYNGETYQMDFDDLKKKIDNRVRMIILCSPHNPVGRVWTRKELIKLADICIKNNILLVSDEIHKDLVYKGHSHTVLASISEEIANNSIICTSPHKTFNIAGLEISNIIIPNDKLRNEYKAALEQDGINKPSLLGMIALRAAYQGGEGWLDSLLGYCQENVKYLTEFIDTNIPGLKVVRPEGTFLVWIDCKKLNVKPKDLERQILDIGKLVVNQGYTFGEDGSGFIRLNIACPRTTLEEALKRLERAIKSL